MRSGLARAAVFAACCDCVNLLTMSGVLGLGWGDGSTLVSNRQYAPHVVTQLKPADVPPVAHIDTHALIPRTLIVGDTRGQTGGVSAQTLNNPAHATALLATLRLDPQHHGMRAQGVPYPDRRPGKGRHLGRAPVRPDPSRDVGGRERTSGGLMSRPVSRCAKGRSRAGSVLSKNASTAGSAVARVWSSAGL